MRSSRRHTKQITWIAASLLPCLSGSDFPSVSFMKPQSNRVACKRHPTWNRRAAKLLTRQTPPLPCFRSLSSDGSGVFSSHNRLVTLPFRFLFVSQRFVLPQCPESRKEPVVCLEASADRPIDTGWVQMQASELVSGGSKCGKRRVRYSYFRGAEIDPRQSKRTNVRFLKFVERWKSPAFRQG